MKDPTNEIYDALETLLKAGSIAYGTNRVGVVSDMPNNSVTRYVWIKDSYVARDYCQDSYITDNEVTIEVGFKGNIGKPSREAISSVTSQVMELLTEQDLTMTSFSHIDTEFLNRLELPEERGSNYIRDRIELKFIIKCEQN